jgi:hypothetical protein
MRIGRGRAGLRPRRWGPVASGVSTRLRVVPRGCGRASWAFLAPLLLCRLMTKSTDSTYRMSRSSKCNSNPTASPSRRSSTSSSSLTTPLRRTATVQIVDVRITRPSSSTPKPKGAKPKDRSYDRKHDGSDAWSPVCGRSPASCPLARSTRTSSVATRVIRTAKRSSPRSLSALATARE